MKCPAARPPLRIRNLTAALLAASALAPSLAGAQQAPGVIGKNEWLFYRYEQTDPAATADTNASIKLISQVQRVFERNGVALAVTLVPLKMRIYEEHLPKDFKMTPYIAGNHDRIAQALQAAKVPFIDLNAAFLASPKRNSETPLYLRLDTHWSPTGAMLAAETIKAAIEAQPALKSAYDQTPAARYTLNWDRRTVISKARDLVPQLPKGAPAFGDEPLLQFYVSRAKPAGGDLVGDGPEVGITLMGSSYSHAWTRFPDALRFTLQRDLLGISVAADQGSWVGMESYLRDDAFQKRKPRLIVWEMPERDLRATPSYKFRDARYQIDNTEWLLRAAAWIEETCKPAPVAPRIDAGGLAGATPPAGDGEIQAATTEEADFVQIAFERPVERLEYLAAQLATAGSKQVVLEAGGPGTPDRRITLPVAGDGAEHVLKTPLVAPAGKGYNRLRLYPGKTSGFKLAGLRLCRQADDLLQ